VVLTLGSYDWTGFVSCRLSRRRIDNFGLYKIEQWLLRSVPFCPDPQPSKSVLELGFDPAARCDRSKKSLLRWGSGLQLSWAGFDVCCETVGPGHQAFFTI
jgi:hypothetical protein